MISATTIHAQDGIESLLSSGLEDTNKFLNNYSQPSSEALVYNLANGWYNTAKVKKLGRFEISVIAGVSQIDDESTFFSLNDNEYNALTFETGSNIQNVGTIFGENNPPINMTVEENGVAVASVTLPQGLGSENIEYFPNIMLQGSVGLPFSTELKLRFLPEVETDDVSTQFFGAGLQHEFTNSIPGLKLLPVALSGFVGYNKLKGDFRFSAQSSAVSASNQSISTDVDSWHYAVLVSTKMPVINFYGSIGAVSGTADTRLKGEYQINTGVSQVQGTTVVDPIQLETSVNGMRATLGTKLTLAFFRLNIDYSFQKFNTLNVGINFGI
jgi:hypothetical protein